MGLVRGLGEINMGVDVWLKRVETTFVASYRDIVWNIFTQILNNTPQFSGRAVANWNLGIGAPDYSVGTGLGDDVLFIEGDQSYVSPNQRGDRTWIAVAEARNKPKLALIKRDTRVYISNGVSGDSDGRPNSGDPLGFKYLEELQDPTYWAKKLRSANKPYETVEETMLRMAMEIGIQHGESFRVGGTNMQVRK